MGRKRDWKSLVLLLVGSASAFGSTGCINEYEIVARHPEVGHVTIHGVTVYYEKVLGRSTSVVFVSTNQKECIKYYRPLDAGLARFEYYALLFLREKGENVPLASPPEQVAEPDAFTREILHNQGFSDTGLVALRKGFTPGRPYFKMAGQLKHQDFVDLEKHRDRTRSYFTSGQFRSWLQAKGIDPVKEQIPPRLVDNPDIHAKDFLRSNGKWILIDP